MRVCARSVGSSGTVKFVIREIFDRGSRTGFLGCDLPSSSNVEEGVTILINFKGRGIIFSSNVEEGVKSFQWQFSQN